MEKQENLTVKKLIEKLQTLDQDNIVYVHDDCRYYALTDDQVEQGNELGVAGVFLG